ncbi:MAG: alanine--glyoxylate aminotransferase family protein [Vicinamibacteria bacterium]|nr:alanine--glyoxylate aminotransferase family protein [Vicinamibacteria bacterium]
MTERLLFGPGPSLVTSRVMSALARPVLGHLDPVLLGVMDDLRARLARVCHAPPGSRVFAVSGTGTSAMETSVANLMEPGKKALVVVTGYFGLRLADIARRYGAEVRTVECEWGRAIDPAAVESALSAFPADIVAIVHAETSTGVRNPVREVAALAHARGALVIADCVTSLGGQEVDMAGWGLDVVYSGAQKCLGAPSGLAPIAFAPAALARMVACRSFYFDAALLEDYWAARKYHHTICSSLVFAFHEALVAIEEEGLEARWARHANVHRAFATGLADLGLSLLPPEDERLMTLNAVRIPDGVNDVAVRTALRERFSIEIGAGMGPLGGKIWRIGLMGASATEAHVLTLLGALKLTIAD